MCHREPPVPLQHPLPRGIYEAPYYDSTGCALLLAITRDHRLASWHRVAGEEDYGRVLDRMRSELDVQDPVALRLEA